MCYNILYYFEWFDGDDTRDSTSLMTCFATGVMTDAGVEEGTGWCTPDEWKEEKIQITLTLKGSFDDVTKDTDAFKQEMRADLLHACRLCKEDQVRFYPSHPPPRISLALSLSSLSLSLSPSLPPSLTPSLTPRPHSFPLPPSHSPTD